MTENNSYIYKYNSSHYCAIYARRSIKIDKQNIETQLSTCRDKANELNLLIFNEYTDFESATKYEPLCRSGFKELVYDMKNNKFKTLIVYKRDRLARKLIHFKEIKALCQKYNVKIIYAANDEIYIDENSPMSSFIENILLAFAEIEPQNIKLRTKDGINKNRSSGIYSSTRAVPKGYIKEGKAKTAKFFPDNDISNNIFDLFTTVSTYAFNKNILKDYTNKINDDHSLSLNNNDIANILINPIYAGYFILDTKYNIESLIKSTDGSLYIDTNRLTQAKNVVPIIKDFTLWEKAVLNYFIFKGFSDVNSHVATSSLFESLLFCKKCNSKVYLVDNTFKCSNHCFSIQKELLFELVLNRIIDDLFTKSSITSHYNKLVDNATQEINSIEAKLQYIERKKDLLLLDMIKSKSTNNHELTLLIEDEKNITDNYNFLKQKMSSYNYYTDNIQAKITSKKKFELVEHFISNPNIGNDFFSSILKKVSVYVYDVKFDSEFEYNISGVH